MSSKVLNRYKTIGKLNLKKYFVIRNVSLKSIVGLNSSGRNNQFLIPKLHLGMLLLPKLCFGAKQSFASQFPSQTQFGKKSGVKFMALLAQTVLFTRKFGLKPFSLISLTPP